MVGILVDWNEQGCTTEYWVGAVTPYMLDGKMTPAGILENMTQSCYAWLGELDGSDSYSYEVIATDNIKIDKLPAFGDELHTRLDVSSQGSHQWIAQVKCWVGKENIARGEVKIRKRYRYEGKRVTIVGGGFSGLLTAALLLQQGAAVTVLEQNHVVGGGLLNFYKDGCWWDTGMHCLCGLHEGSWCWGVLESLGIDIPVEKNLPIIYHGGEQHSNRFREFLYPVLDNQRMQVYREYTFGYPDQMLIGGSRILLNQLVDFIKSAGGEIITKADVCTFDIDKTGNVCSVRTLDGKKYLGDVFVSTIHIKQLMRMCPSPLFKKSTTQRILDTPESSGGFEVYIKLKEGKIENKKEAHYILSDDIAVYFPIDDADQQWCDKMVLFKWINFDELRRWKDKRDEKYYQWKDEKAKYLIDKVSEYIPKLKDAISSYFTSSSLTFRDEFHSPEGSLYGILQEIQSVETKIPNLFLSGQDCFPHGFGNMIAISIRTRDAVLEYLSTHRD